MNGWLGLLTMVLFWIGVILLVVWGLSNAFPSRQSAEPGAEEILKRRPGCDEHTGILKTRGQY